jgi:cytoskeletal protein CcmA (bactofilin family)
VRFFIVAILVVVASLTIAFWPESRPVERAERGARTEAPVVAQDYPITTNANTFFDDLEVRSGQTLAGDVVVYDGDVEVQDDGQILGNLVVYSGDVDIQDGGHVAGSVSAFSGDVTVSGSVGGNIATWSGDIELSDSAEVGGDVSVLSGEIEQDGEARIGGNVLRGPSLRLPELPAIPFGSGIAPAVDIEAPAEDGVGWGAWLWSILVRAFGLGVTALLAGALAALLTYVQPKVVRKVQLTLETSAALAFVTGIVTNIALVVLVAILAVTICLAPLAIVPGLLLVGLNLVGWVGLAAVLAGKLSAGSRTSPAIWTGASAMLLTGALGLVLLFQNPCLMVVGGLATFVASSLSVGGAMLPLAQKYMGARAIANGSPAPAYSGTQHYTVIKPERQEPPIQ